MNTQENWEEADNEETQKALNYQDTKDSLQATLEAIPDEVMQEFRQDSRESIKPTERRCPKRIIQDALKQMELKRIG